MRLSAASGKMGFPTISELESPLDSYQLNLVQKAQEIIDDVRKASGGKR